MAAAIARITRRHRDDDGPGRHLLTDDPREVIAFLRRCGSAGLRGDDHSHDLEDLLVLRFYLWWEGQENERWALDAGEKIRFDRRRLGRVLGVSTPQGVHDRLDRLLGLFGPARRPHQRYARIARGTAAGSQLPDSPAPAPVNSPGLRDALAAMIAHLDDFPEDIIEDLVPLKRETTRWAQLSDRELVGDLRLLLVDLVDVQLPAGTRQAVDVVERIVAGR
jgi:hypothetical protein